LDRVKAFNAEIFPYMATHFEAPDETYRVFIRKALVAYGGSGFMSSYVLEYDETVEDETDDEIRELFTHEMVHSFSTMDEEEDGYDNAWFTEGLTASNKHPLTWVFGVD
jgi:predicted metalloprotease with PDZ domain